MNKLIISSLLLVNIVSINAFADDISSGFYLGARAGVTMLRPTQNTLSSTTTAGALTDTVSKLEVAEGSHSVFSPSLALGYTFNTSWQQPIRLELAYSDFGRASQSNTLNTIMNSTWTSGSGYHQNYPTTLIRQQSLRARTLMLNGYYDYTLGSSITPWVMGGVGVAFLHGSTTVSQSAAGIQTGPDTYGQSASNIAWSVGAGVTWTITPSLSLDTGYIYTNAGDLTTNGYTNNGIINGSWNSHTRLYMHTFQTGLRYNF
ncbi:outer membrane beta-barrel protein [Pantoea ananatis]|uniref:outer membrane beta-barrel protein n=1 Tax=Pantoea ananas TaxID=553 RepID=UPI000F8875C2|nr:outer membrane beta-barrel protein [Pantoea ananatis]RQN05295.1 porin family protein [Pantoea ananatis]